MVTWLLVVCAMAGCSDYVSSAKLFLFELEN